MKLIDIYAPISKEHLLILAAANISEQQVKEICMSACKIAIREEVERIERESYEIQMNQINNKIFNQSSEIEDESEAG